MDTIAKEKLIEQNVILMLPDEPDNIHGPATLFMVPRHVVRAWIKMTPKLNAVMEELQHKVVAKALATNPVEAKEYFETKGKSNDGFINKILEDPAFLKGYRIITVSAIADLRETMGAEEFNSYAVTDPEVIRSFASDVEWGSYSSETGLNEAKPAEEAVQVGDDGKLRIKKEATP